MVRRALDLSLALCLGAACNGHRYGYFGDGEGAGGTSTGEPPDSTSVTLTAPDPSRPDPTQPDPTRPDPSGPDPTTMTTVTVTTDPSGDPTSVPGVCGERELPSAVPVQGFSDNFAGHDLFLLGCNPTNAAEAVFVWTAPFDGVFEVHTVGSSFDTVLSLQSGLCGGGELGCNDDAIGAFSSVTTPLAAGQTVTAVVEGVGGQQGDVVISVEAVSEPEPPLCVVNANIDGLTGDFSGSTVGQGSEWSGACGGLDAPEFVFSWTPPFGGNFRLEITDASFDSVLYVRQSECAGLEIGCNDDANDLRPLLELFVASENGPLLIFVDAVDGGSGGFGLRITPL